MCAKREDKLQRTSFSISTGWIIGRDIRIHLGAPRGKPSTVFRTPRYSSEQLSYSCFWVVAASQPADSITPSAFERGFPSCTRIRKLKDRPRFHALEVRKLHHRKQMKMLITLRAAVGLDNSGFKQYLQRSKTESTDTDSVDVLKQSA